MVKLTRGVGSPATGGCWMVAASYYASGEWHDHPACVCPTIRALCIFLNDRIWIDEERERLIGPHLFTPVGTAAGRGMEWRRTWHVLDWMVHDWLPWTHDSPGILPILLHVPRIDSLQAAEKAEAAIVEMAIAWPSAARALEALRGALAGDTQRSVQVAVSLAAQPVVLQLILDLCAMTERKELPSPAHTREETVRALEEAHACGAARC